MLILVCLFAGAAGLLGALAGNTGAIIAAPLLLVGLAIWKGSDGSDKKQPAASDAPTNDSSTGTSGSTVTIDMLNELISPDGTYHTPRALQDIDEK